MRVEAGNNAMPAPTHSVLVDDARPVRCAALQEDPETFPGSVKAHVAAARRDGAPRRRCFCNPGTTARPGVHGSFFARGDAARADEDADAANYNDHAVPHGPARPL